MKKLFAFATLVVALVVSSCSYDDAPVWDKLNNHEERITSLETLCKQMNTNIEALQAIVEALEKNDFITNVTPIEEGGEVIGYTITFAKGEPITIYHGEDGEDGANGSNGNDGQTPEIGVAQDTDGVYYWTVNGEWLLDAAGNKVKAIGQDGANGDNGAAGNDGVTPSLKIENNTWYVSYDNGATWVELGVIGESDAPVVADSIFKSVTEDDSYVYFTLADDSVIKIAKATPLDIVFNTEALNGAVSVGKTYEIGYTVDSYAESVEVEAIAANNVADVEVVAEEALTGVIRVTIGDKSAVNSKVIVLVSDGDRVIMRSITLEAETIKVEADTTIEVEADGGNVELAFLSNVEYSVVIPEEATWITIPEATRALESHIVTLAVAGNDTTVERSAVVKIVAANGSPIAVEYTIVQAGQPLPVIATPVVSTTVDGNVVTLTWEAIENAGSYSITTGTEMPVIVEDTTYTFTGDYETEYTFNITAIPADEASYGASLPATVTVTTGIEIVEVTVEEFIAATKGDGVVYQLTGEITSITNTTYGNFYLKDSTGEILVYGLDFGDSGLNWTGGTNLNVGDTITITGSRGEYNGTAQVADGAYVSHIDGEEPVVEPTKVTVAEFLAAAESNTDMYELTGVITSVVNTTYGNFYLKDSTGEVYIYGLCSPEGEQKYWAESGAKVGDTITVQTIRTSYSGTPQGKNAIFVSLVPFVEAASEWGIVGDLTSWGSTTDIVMYNTWKAENLFVAYDVEIASGAFKIRANNKWDDAKNYGLKTAGNIYADKYYSVITSGGSQNITPMAYGTYDVYFDLANSRVALITPGAEYADAVDGGNPVVVIAGLTDHSWGLIGSFEGSGWSTDVAMTIEGDWAVAKNVSLATGNEFKFRADGAWDLSYGSACDVNIGETYTTYNNGGNMKFVGEAGAYNIYFSMVDASFYMEEYRNETSVTFDAVALGLANQTALESYTVGDVTVAFAGGGNNNSPKYYTSGSAVRCYPKNTITISGKTVTKVEVVTPDNYTNALALYDGDTALEGFTWEGASDNLVLTFDPNKTSGQSRFVSINITYNN